MKPLISAWMLAGVLVSAPVFGQTTADTWVATWATADAWRPPASAATAAPPAANVPPPLQVHDQTLRQVVRASIGGARVRVVLSNAFGTQPLAVGAARVGLRADGATMAAGHAALTFGGRPAATIPSGATLVSDPVALSVPPMSDLAIDLYLPGDSATWSSPLTLHTGAFSTSYVSEAGNQTGVETFPVARTFTSWWVLSRVEVSGGEPARAVVTFGDSITDGTRSTVDANNRWPDELSRRLRAQPATARLAVANVAIAGNRLLSEANPSFGINALARFDRDVAAVPGAAWIVVLEGINDIGMNPPEAKPTADDLTAAYRQLIARAHADGLKIIGATLTPFEGAGYFYPGGEAVRQAVNQWIRSSGAFDGVIDFDAVIRDPATPSKMRAEFDSGDHLHPNDAGYKAMGQAVDLALFR